MRKNLLSLLLLFLCCATFSVSAQNSRGKDFWLMFNDNSIDGDPALSLYITSEVNTTGNVSIVGLGFYQDFTVNAGEVTTIEIPSSAQFISSDLIENKAIHVSSVENIVVYGLNRRIYTTDAFLAIPTNSLGFEHLVLSYFNELASKPSQLGIVASQDNTTVTITPSNYVDGHQAGVPYTIVLNRNQAYQLKSYYTYGSSSDLTGTVVLGDKPISVFGSHMCANVPPTTPYCDHIVEQIPAVTTWGKEFLTASYANRTMGDIFRVLAANNETVVSLNGTVIATLNRGEFKELDLPSNSYNQISTSKPTLLAQFSKGSYIDNTPSDPFMSIVPPREQYFGSTTFTTPATGFTYNFVNIITPNAGVGVITLDGNTIPSSEFTSIGSTGFSGARVSVTSGAHRLSAPNIAFEGFVYGFSSDDSYGYPAGQVYASIATATTLLLAAPSNTNVPVGTNSCFTATLLGPVDNPIEGAKIDFKVDGVSAPQASFGFTDAFGNVQFCFLTYNSGVDNVNAKLGNLEAAAMISSFCNTSAVYLENPIDNYNTEKIFKQTTDTITANNQISGSANVVYRSGKSIVLDASNGGFTVNSGTVFKAEIVGCN